MRTAIVGNTVVGRFGDVVDVGVAARHRVARRAIGIGERYVVCSDQAMTAVANLGAPAEIDFAEWRTCKPRCVSASVGEVVPVASLFMAPPPAV